MNHRCKAIVNPALSTS